MARFVIAALDGSKLTTRQQWFNGEQWVDCPTALDIKPGTAETNVVFNCGKPIAGRPYPLRLIIEEGAGERATQAE